MTGEEIVFGVVVGTSALLLIVAIATWIAAKFRVKEVSNIQNIYIKRLENTDCPIKNAISYLELTNGIRQ